MVEELYNVYCPQIVIIMAIDHENPIIYVKNRLDYEKEVDKIFGV
jgi:hypothetical protein